MAKKATKGTNGSTKKDSPIGKNGKGKPGAFVSTTQPPTGAGKVPPKTKKKSAKKPLG